MVAFHLPGFTKSLKTYSFRSYTYIMNRKILLGAILAGIIAIVIYNFQGASTNTEGYVDEVLAHRADIFKEFKESEESPLTDEQKAVFKELSYFPVSEKYKVKADFHKNLREQIVKINITDGSLREYFVYGNAHFHLEGKELDVTVYKPVKASSEYLFIPFYDITSADLTYGGGRYVEPEVMDDGSMEIDFNMAYNPYCAYNHSYRCPVPPQENSLNVSILAGEKIPDFIK